MHKFWWQHANSSNQAVPFIPPPPNKGVVMYTHTTHDEIYCVDVLLCLKISSKNMVLVRLLQRGAKDLTV